MATVKKSEIYDRDYSAPTEFERFDRSILPKIMQVRNFGKRSRTKWQHLAVEDTTRIGQPDEKQNDRDLSGYAKGTVTALGAPMLARSSGGGGGRGGAGGYGMGGRGGGGARGAGAGAGFSSRGGKGDDGFSKPKKFKT